MRLPHQTLVFVGDGRKALFLRNHGDAERTDLRTEQTISHENPSTREQGADRPTRTFNSTGDGRRSGVQQSDWHEIGETNFAREAAKHLKLMVEAGGRAGLVIVAPPRTLAELRKALDPHVAERVIGEINKDLTRHPLHDIEKHLAEA